MTNMTAIQDDASTHSTPDDIRFLQIKDVTKNFGGVKALRGVGFSIYKGKTYHLLGENGCGKSTLIKIISGTQPASSGAIEISGIVQDDLTPVKALAAGIQTVYQDLSLLPNLTVEENIGLSEQLVDSEANLFRVLSHSRVRQTAVSALKAVKLPTHNRFLKTPIQLLPIATRQLVAIARAIASEARLVIMDEPTTALTKREVDNLVSVVSDMHERGVSVIFVTHKLDECKEIGGHAIIMRDGEVVKECDIDSISKQDIGFYMTGKRLEEGRLRPEQEVGPIALSIKNLTREGAFNNINFDVGSSEIVGITGLLDSGRNELALALSGVQPAQAGQIALNNTKLNLQTPSDAIDAGIGYVPEDRLAEGLFLEKPIRDNIIIAVLKKISNALGIINRESANNLAKSTIDDLNIVAPDIHSPVQSLSGGNQQRVLIGRWLTIEPKVLILHGPTVGVDVGSKDTIFKIIQQLSEKSMAVIIISDDLPELLQNCDRILVMRNGELVQNFNAEGLKEKTLYKAISADDKNGETA